MTAAPDPETLALCRYLEASPSPYHAVAEAAALLEGAGFKPLDELAAWDDVAGARFVIRGGALIAWRVPESLPAHAGLRVVGAHTDSPNLRVKPKPDTGGLGWRQVGVDVYGGALVNSWLDRDLGLSGRLSLADGGVRLVKVDRPLLRVCQLAIHLDRDVNDKGVVLDRQQHLAPVWGLGTPRQGDLAAFLAADAGVAPGDVTAWDVMLHDLTPPAVLGVDEELLASARLDNLFSSWCAVTALAAAEAPGRVAPMVALFDHEEIGSESTTGAAGPFLQAMIERLVAARGGDRDDLHRALAASIVVSADMAHAVHPNYPDRHEPNHRPLPNGGPVIKVNANQRYATDAPSHAAFVRACEAAGVPWQVYSHRSNLACGSTIGPITAARLGMPVVDVGCAQLSMHSARELAGSHDPALLAAALGAFLAGA
jgi:aspartyl aminopeptidase